MLMPRHFLTLLLLLAAGGSVAAQEPAPAASQAGSGPVSTLLAGTRASVFGVIQGNALNSNGARLAKAGIRLRDARTGRIIDAQTTDEVGLFAFRAVDPGSYIVELVANDQSVLAASQILNINAGESLSTVVKLPLGSAPLGGLLGRSTGSALVVASAAAAAGVLATAVTGQPASPVR